MSEELESYPSVGPPGEQIHTTRCAKCNVAIGFYELPAPTLCGHCERAE